MTHRSVRSSPSSRTRKRAIRPLAAVVVLCALSAGPIASAAASDPGGSGPGGAARPSGAPIVEAAPSLAYAATIHGGYVTAGVGLRNRGAGNLTVSGIPSGAQIVKAYLFWAVLGGSPAASNFDDGVFGGSAITGTLIGSGPTPLWPPTTNGYAYRANVTQLINGNGGYALSGFASGRTNGADPFTEPTSLAPLAEGASLVVVYSRADLPRARVVVHNGYSMIHQQSRTITMSWGFGASGSLDKARTTFIGGDGQLNYTESATRFNGTTLASVDWDGTDGPLPRYSQGNLWDTDTVNVTALVRPGAQSANIQVAGFPDALVWVAQVLSVSLQ